MVPAYSVLFAVSNWKNFIFKFSRPDWADERVRKTILIYACVGSVA